MNHHAVVSLTKGESSKGVTQPFSFYCQSQDSHAIRIFLLLPHLLMRFQVNPLLVHPLHTSQELDGHLSFMNVFWMLSISQARFLFFSLKVSIVIYIRLEPLNHLNHSKYLKRHFWHCYICIFFVVRCFMDCFEM